MLLTESKAVSSATPSTTSHRVVRGDDITASLVPSGCGRKLSIWALLMLPIMITLSGSLSSMPRTCTFGFASVISSRRCDSEGGSRFAVAPESTVTLMKLEVLAPRCPAASIDMARTPTGLAACPPNMSITVGSPVASAPSAPGARMMTITMSNIAAAPRA